MFRDPQHSLECRLSSEYAAVSYQIECESESSCVIAWCLFPFVSTSVSWWQQHFVFFPFLGTGSVFYGADEPMKWRLCTGHLAPAAVRLMWSAALLGRWQLHQEVGPKQSEGAQHWPELPTHWTIRWMWRLAGWRPRMRRRAGGGCRVGGKGGVRGGGEGPSGLNGVAAKKSLWYKQLLFYCLTCTFSSLICSTALKLLAASQSLLTL